MVRGGPNMTAKTTVAQAPDFCALFESSPGCYLVLSPDLKIVAVTQAYLTATMTRREDILGRSLFEVFPDNPQDHNASGVAHLGASLQRVKDNLAPDTMAVQKYDIRRPAHEGGGFEQRWWSPVNSPVLARDGTLAWIIHRVEDVTDFVRVRQQGEQQERLTRDLEGRASRMEADILRRGQELQQANQEVRRLNAELEQRVEERTAQLKKAQDQLLHAQKMEAVGRLAGGVAHDFNNVLSVIISYSSMMMTDMPPTDPARHDVEQIKIAADRAAALTRQLLAFSRQQVLEARVLDLNSVVQGVETMLTRLIGADVDLAFGLKPGVHPVMADPGQLEQVLMNLAINARDAMPRGGKLTIETGNVELDQHYADEHLGVHPGAYAMLAVSDTGTGMDKATLARIFEPFFTTKPQGKGTGLGLATAMGIIQQSGGSIWAYSEPDNGTTFKVYLPRTTEAAGPQAEPDTAVAVLHGTETILLAEDEAQVRTVVRGILEQAGYVVLEAADAGEALALCERHPGPIHLVLTDVVMPQMNGRQLADRLCAMRPGLPVLFMSGYTDGAIMLHGMLESGLAFLQKPFTPQSLARRVRQVLDGAKRA